MGATCFVDTNVLVYARDASEPEKQPLAIEWMAALWERRAGRLSHQVLHEYYVTVTQRLQPGLDRSAARDEVRALLAWHPIPVDQRVLEAAWAVQDRYGLSFWDALIVGAAQCGGCRYLLSEHLQHDQRLGELTVLNPFEARPEQVLT